MKVVSLIETNNFDFFIILNQGRMQLLQPEQYAAHEESEDDRTRYDQIHAGQSGPLVQTCPSRPD